LTNKEQTNDGVTEIYKQAKEQKGMSEDVSEFAILNQNFSEETDNKLIGTIIK
jgi:hypothetical protein